MLLALHVHFFLYKKQKTTWLYKKFMDSELESVSS